MNLEYMLQNDNINIENKTLKILNIYNLRLLENTNWYNILFIDIPEDVQKLLRVIYDCKIPFNNIYMIILKHCKLLDIFYNVENELKTKTFIKYFFDKDMIDEEFLYDLSEENYNTNSTYILNYHNITEELSLKKYDKNRINKYKIKNSIHNDKRYYLLKIKNNEDIFYTQELVKLKNTWWLITTKWNKYYYNYKEIKVILWIFSEII